MTDPTIADPADAEAAHQLCDLIESKFANPYLALFVNPSGQVIITGNAPERLHLNILFTALTANLLRLKLSGGNVGDTLARLIDLADTTLAVEGAQLTKVRQ